MNNELLTETEVAKELKVAPPTLRGWRSDGILLPYLKFGRNVRYRRADIEEFKEKSLVVPNN